MRFGINTLLWTAGFDESNLPLLPEFRKHGFDGVEIARFDFGGFPAAKIGRAAADEGLGCIGCSALTGSRSLISDDAAVRRDADAFLRGAIEATAELGADTLVGPFCSPVGYNCGRRRNAEEWRLGVEGLQALAPFAAQHNVTIAIEPLNRFETFFLNTAQDAVKLCDAVGHSNVGVLFDTFHANIEEKDVGAAFGSLGSHLKHVHACENDRGTPGSGHVPWTAVARALQGMRYDRWVVIESFGAAIPEIAAAACIWRDLAGSSEAIAYDGLAFLKQLFRA